MNTNVLLTLATFTGVVGFVLWDRKGPVTKLPQHMAGDDNSPDPPKGAPQILPPEAFVPKLDADMTGDQAQAVGIALATESSVSNLREFAGTLTPDFPIAAGLLNTKARLIAGK